MSFLQRVLRLCRKEEEAIEEALKTNLKSKKTDEQAREKAQKVQQDEAERVQQLAANRAAQSAFGASAKWQSWGTAEKRGGAAGGGTPVTAKKGTPAAKAAALAAGSSSPSTPAPIDRDANMQTPVSGRPVPAGSGTVNRVTTLKPAGWAGGHEGPTVTLKDLITALERDPLYAKSSLLYQLMESSGFF